MLTYIKNINHRAERGFNLLINGRHEEPTKDYYTSRPPPTASTLPHFQSISRPQTADKIGDLLIKIPNIGRSETVLIVCFWCFLAYFRAVLTASKHQKQLYFYHFYQYSAIFLSIFIKNMCFFYYFMHVTPSAPPKSQHKPTF